MGISRRTLLASAAASLGSLGLAKLAPAQAVKPRGRRSLRVVLLTDSHLPATGKNDLIVKAFDRVHNQEKPDFVLFGGDNIMAVDSEPDFEKAKAQFDNWSAIVKGHIKAPYASVIGNHDIWSWSASNPMAGKGFALKYFEMPNRFHAKDVKNWRFLMLDTFHRDGCRIDDEQFKWLSEQIKGTTKNVLLLSHAPILSVSGLIEDGAQKPGNFAVPHGWYTANSVKLRNLFFDCPNVKIALSGHMHHVDRCDYDQVSYICGGAVSGAWWGGDYYKFGPAYVVLDLFENGGFEHRVVYWQKS